MKTKGNPHKHLHEFISLIVGDHADFRTASWHYVVSCSSSRQMLETVTTFYWSATVGRIHFIPGNTELVLHNFISKNKFSYCCHSQILLKCLVLLVQRLIHQYYYCLHSTQSKASWNRNQTTEEKVNNSKILFMFCYNSALS